MEYFVLTLDDKVVKPTTFTFLPQDNYNDLLKKSDFSLLEPMKVAFFTKEKNQELTDILTQPCILFSDKLRDVLEKIRENVLLKSQYFYVLEEEAKGTENIVLPPDPDPNDFWRCIQIITEDDPEGALFRYWVYDMAKVDCLHQKTEFYPNRMVKHLVLDRKKIPKDFCFSLGGLLEQRVIVNLTLAEAIMRSKPYGVQLQNVEVR